MAKTLAEILAAPTRRAAMRVVEDAAENAKRIGELFRACGYKEMTEEEHAAAKVRREAEEMKAKQRREQASEILKAKGLRLVCSCCGSDIAAELLDDVLSVSCEACERSREDY